MKSTALSGASAFLTVLMVGSAHAQTPPETVDKVVVTGSRIVRDGYEAPTPQTVVGEDVLEKRAPATIVEALVNLPSLKNVATPDTAGSSVAGSAGQSFLNLRGLGANRTLILMDGVRVAPSLATGAVDVALLPSGLISRVDVVTGGASAAWGSDAVAGVVNFVMDTEMTGLKGDIEGGVSSRGDAKNAKADLTYGTPLFSDRGHLLLSGEYYQTDGAEPNSRWWADSAGVITNPQFTSTNGQPRVLLVPHLYWVSPQDGLVNSGPLRGLTFLPDGTPSTYSFCNYAGTSFEACASADLSRPSSPHYNYMSVPQTRAVGYGRFSYEFTPEIEGYIDYLHGESNTKYFSGSPSSFISGNFTIQNDNAYLPASVRTQMAALNITNFPFSRSFDDFGVSTAGRDVILDRAVVGVNADLALNWKLKASYERGHARNTFRLGNNAIIASFRNALDAVTDPATGRIVCRSTLTFPTNGCVPINPFIRNTPTTSQLQYTMGTSYSKLNIDQDFLQANLSGDAFSLWAGPVSVAVGAEYRKEKAEQVADALSTAGRFALANPKPLKGDYDAKEAYGEVIVPLVKDLPLANALDLNAAVRYTDYSTSGKATTWKVGLTYDPVADVRLRMTRSRDLRAPNVLELYSTSVQSTGSVTDPFTNQQYSYQGFSTGNPNLAVESAETTAVGVVLRPRFAPSLSASIDYYKIDLSDAIQTISQQDIVNRCFNGNTELCGLITRNSANAITSITSPYLNLASIKTDGVDIDVTYRLDFGAAGTLSLQALASHVNKYIVSDGVTARDQADSLNDQQPSWTGNFTADYSVDRWSLFYNLVYISGGKFSTQYVLPNDIDQNSVEAYYVHNVTVDFDLTPENKGANVLYFSIANVADQEPPFPIWGNGSSGYYEKVGRRFRAGYRFRF